MECGCNSKNLYKNYQSLTFKLDGKELNAARCLHKQMGEVPTSHRQIIKSIYENSQMFVPTQMDSIEMQEIYAHPLWFYKNYIALNRPCIINNALNFSQNGYGDIRQEWSDPEKFAQIGQESGKISVSVTPDGFADSIKNQYFIQPVEIKATIKDVIDWKHNQKQNNPIKPHWIPYVQHQNSNLTQQLQELHHRIDHEMKGFISQQFFQGNEPDATNFWMGYCDSVSAIHKDPYQNFYTTIVGQKHFTLLPPVSIAFMQQQQYKTAAWKIQPDAVTLSASEKTQSQYTTTRWISCNPDLQSDWELFPELSNLKQQCLHVVIQAGQSMYLPSLWYHQVAQTHEKSPYAVAINYWFDMAFDHKFTLYETVRKLKGYS